MSIQLNKRALALKFRCKMCMLMLCRVFLNNTLQNQVYYLIDCLLLAAFNSSLLVPVDKTSDMFQIIRLDRAITTQIDIITSSMSSKLYYVYSTKRLKLALNNGFSTTIER